MKQSSYRYLGLFDLLLVAALVGVFWPSALAGSVVVPGMLVAGILMLLAGTIAELSIGPVTVTWRHFVGVSYGIFALVMPAIYAPTVLAGAPGGEDIMLFVAAIVGGGSLLFYGVDVARDGRHFEVDADVERAIGR